LGYCKAVIGGSVWTTGHGVQVHNGGLAVIKKELTADPDNYISVDGIVLTKYDFSSENTGPYGGREYTNSGAELPSYVYVNVPERRTGRWFINDAHQGAAVTIAVLLVLFVLMRKRH
jgi:hypothetical protein